MKKRRRKQYKSNVGSRNALVDSPRGKKRFGKKQKKKLLIIASVILIVIIGISFVVNHYQEEKKRAEDEAKKGKIIDTEAEKQQFDDEGNPIVTHKDTEIHIINCGNGNSTLIKKGNYEVLIDCGSDVTDYLEKNISGDLEYLILTNNFEGCIGGVAPIYEKFNVLKTIYTNPNDTVNKLIAGKTAMESKEQIIDMGENVIVSLGKPLSSKKDTDKSTVVTVYDNEQAFYIAGTASPENVINNPPNNDVKAYILGPNPSSDMLSGRIMRSLNAYEVIISSKDKIDANIIAVCDANKYNLYATYKSKTIVYKIDADGIVTSNIDYDTTIRPEEPEEEPPTEEDSGEVPTEEETNVSPEG